MLTHGFEFEVIAGADELIYALRGTDDMLCRELHGYHCDCSECAVFPYDRDLAPTFHAQTDSSCGGEIISKVFDNIEETRSAVRRLASAVRSSQAEVNSRCGLHVHVSARGNNTIDEAYSGYNPESVNKNVGVAWLLTERYIMEMIAPGGAMAKRDMNQTVLQQTRNYQGGMERIAAQIAEGSWQEVREHVMSAIRMDRHVDLSYSQRLGTWEFRVFNSTVHAWRIELAIRLSIAFVQAANDIVDATGALMEPTDLYPIFMGRRWPTMRPRITMAEFINILSKYDPGLRNLMMRQCQFMRARYRPEFDYETLDERDEEAREIPPPPPPRQRTSTSFQGWSATATGSAYQPVYPAFRETSGFDDIDAAWPVADQCECEYCTEHRAVRSEQARARIDEQDAIVRAQAVRVLRDLELEQLLDEAEVIVNQRISVNFTQTQSPNGFIEDAQEPLWSALVRARRF